MRALSEEFGGDEAAVKEFMTTSPEMREFVCGRLGNADMWQTLRAATGITASDEELATRWVRDYEIDQSVRLIVQKVRQSGYKTCVCTNNNAVRLPALEAKFGFDKDFDAVVSSHEVGYTKPSREIFETLLARVGVAPSELVYTDDNPDRLQGAIDLGITTFVYHNFPQFVGELRKLGVQI